MNKDTDSQSALIVMAHGSRLNSANEEFFQLVKTVFNQTSDYTLVVPALLEQASPSLLQACETVLSKGIHQVDVYPLFFNHGRHVGKDIPMQVAEAMEAFPKLNLRLLDYFGSNINLANAIESHITEQRQ